MIYFCVCNFPYPLSLKIAQMLILGAAYPGKHVYCLVRNFAITVRRKWVNSTATGDKIPTTPGLVYKLQVVSDNSTNSRFGTGISWTQTWYHPEHKHGITLDTPQPDPSGQDCVRIYLYQFVYDRVRLRICGHDFIANIVGLVWILV